MAYSKKPGANHAMANERHVRPMEPDVIHQSQLPRLSSRSNSIAGICTLSPCPTILTTPELANQKSYLDCLGKLNHRNILDAAARRLPPDLTPAVLSR